MSKTSYQVLSRVVAICDSSGRKFRSGKAKWGKWRIWNKYADIESNINQAVSIAKAKVDTSYVGTVIYIRPVTDGVARNEVVPIFDVKRGYGGMPYIAWKANPAAGYWQRRVERVYGSLTK